MDRYPEIAWPEEYSEIKTFENLLKCQICYDYMDTPVVTACSHNYCSLCIRKYLHYKTRCPLCFKDAFENELRPNRLLEEIVSQFGKIREKLKSLVKINKHAKNSDDNLQTTDSTRESANNKKPMTRSARKSVEDNNNGTKSEDNNDNNNNKNNDNNSKALKRLSNSRKLESVTNEFEEADKSQKSPSKLIKVSSSKEGDVDIEQEKNVCEKVICSVCKVEILMKHKDKHIEVCKEREAVPSISQKTESKRKPLPKLVINLMKDTELKRKMKELGLPTQGTRKTLESRYHRYCTLYNAECDKKEPRSVAQLLKQCKDDEALEKKLSKVS